ncbi:uncharacterized protein LOC117588436 [Drosophila guanche]|uniref:Uncharacterized protein n=1 Tax=Drosophila guanche TaxID=7266 RepID=A0A3B0KNG4_DROGU|nr:uncharacterized protein LOC117588436 [Drosophila guanche]SPP86691.1 Hypothetical predicted protein [Drosophila guanche]
MFRLMDMREAVLSSAVKHSLLCDSQRNGRFLDTKARVPSCEKPVVKAPLRKAPRVKGRMKPKMTEIKRMLMRKAPEPKDPFKQLFPNGHKSVVPVYWKEFFQIDCAIRPIKPYSNSWHDVKAPHLVEQLMSEMKAAKSKAKNDVDLVESLEELKGHKSKDRSAIDRHIKQVMLSVMAEPEISSKGMGKQLAMSSAEAKSQLAKKEGSCEPGSKLLVPKVGKAIQKPQNQAPNLPIRERNTGYVADKETEEAKGNLAAEKSLKTDGKDAKTLDTGASGEPQVNLFTEEAEELQISMSPNSMEEPKENIGAGEDALGLLEMNEKANNLVAKDAQKTKAADVKTLENGACGEPEMELIKIPKNMSEQKDIGAAGVQQEQIVLAKENSP